MKQSFMILLTAYSLLSISTLCAKEAESNVTKIEIEEATIITIDLDLELQKIKEKSQRGKEDNVIDTVIFIEENKEIIFEGILLEKNSPVKVTVSRIIDDDEDNDEVSFSGNKYTISTLGLHDGDRIIMKDKEDKIFVNQIIRTE